MNKENIIKQISLTTSVKNRWDGYLQQALPTWYKYPFKEIVIVDWSSDVPIKEQMIKDNLNRGLVRLITVEDQQFYEHSRARNLKVDSCQEGYILSVDSDIKITDKFMGNMMNLSPKKFYGCNFIKFNDSRVGTCIFDKKAYIDVGGCNENMHGWGFEDLDLYMRLSNSGYSHFKIDMDWYEHIPHDDAMRVVNTRYQNKWVSNSENMYIGSRNTGKINWIPPHDIKYTEEIV